MARWLMGLISDLRSLNRYNNSLNGALGDLRSGTPDMRVLCEKLGIYRDRNIPIKYNIYVVSELRQYQPQDSSENGCIFSTRIRAHMRRKVFPVEWGGVIDSSFPYIFSRKVLKSLVA